MDDINDFLWLFLAYLAGSFATYFLFYKTVTINAVEKTIDGLIENGYLKHSKTPDGDVLLHKYDE